jgi:hypothetical protein
MSVFKPLAASRRICGQKARNMWPKSMEYVADKHGICGQKAQICGQKAQDLGPKNAELSFNYL